jgi:pimeloyl-ACP methyl ester carboxylesterase
MFSGFTPSHRSGTGSPLVCLHGFMDTWRTWDLVLAMLEGQHDVLALTLPGHAGGPSTDETVSTSVFVDAVERLSTSQPTCSRIRCSVSRAARRLGR